MTSSSAEVQCRLLSTMPASSKAPPTAKTAKAKAKGTSQGKGSEHTSQGTGSESGYTTTTNAVTSCTNRGAKAMKTRSTAWTWTGPICRDYTEPQLEGFDTVRGEGLETEHNDNEPPLEGLVQGL